MIDLENWPDWGARLFWTVLTLTLAWSIGHAFGAIAMARLPKWLRERQQVVLTSAARVVRKRLPWWALLIGAWLAVGYWPLPPQAHLLAVQTIFVLGALSVTFALAAIASQSVDTYGTYLAPALPVSSLTRNLAFAIVATLDGMDSSRCCCGMMAAATESHQFTRRRPRCMLRQWPSTSQRPSSSSPSRMRTGTSSRVSA